MSEEGEGRSSSEITVTMKPDRPHWDKPGELHERTSNMMRAFDARLAMAERDIVDAARSTAHGQAKTDDVSKCLHLVQHQLRRIEEGLPWLEHRPYGERPDRREVAKMRKAVESARADHGPQASLNRQINKELNDVVRPRLPSYPPAERPNHEEELKRLREAERERLREEGHQHYYLSSETKDRIRRTKQWVEDLDRDVEEARQRGNTSSEAVAQEPGRSREWSRSRQPSQPRIRSRSRRTQPSETISLRDADGTTMQVDVLPADTHSLPIRSRDQGGRSVSPGEGSSRHASPSRRQGGSDSSQHRGPSHASRSSGQDTVQRSRGPTSEQDQPHRPPPMLSGGLTQMQEPRSSRSPQRRNTNSPDRSRSPQGSDPRGKGRQLG
ncbi:MAG: hypothetical protein M1828_005893 [Chrysothrix sp. TS-e1954]|nr:MAG: hypothetical protein M1828_005893 [Chrysothrix sp. TS-e1954]